MTWSEFKAVVDELLGVERRRLGVQPFIDRQVRLGVGNSQRLIDYYRHGIVTTYDHDDVARDGFSSKLELPRGADLREIYHIRTGKIWVRRPLHEYAFSNRDDLRNGVVGIGSTGGFFRYALDARNGGRDLWVYPMVTRGYAVQVVWDAIMGRTDHEYDDSDEVPFDEPLADLVHEWVKWKLAREVDRDLTLAKDYERTYRVALSALYSEVEERKRLKRAVSEADCMPCSDPCATLATTCGCGYSDVLSDGYSCPEIENPQVEWVMFGDSGERATIQNTIAVATAVKALNPEFVVHLGDMVYGTTRRPTDVGTPPAVGESKGGSPHLFYDLLVKHYWNYFDCNFYFTLGNHDLEYDYGASFMGRFHNVANLIGVQNVAAKKYWYSFARGPVRFISFNSGSNDDDPLIHPDEAMSFVRSVCRSASEPWIVVFFHRPAYCSDVNNHPGSLLMRQLTSQMRSEGVDLVVCGHSHNYERVMDSHGLTHVICGLGGASRRGTADSNMPVGSQMFYSDKHGFLHFKADEETLQWELRTVDNEIVDRVTLRKTADVCVEADTTTTPEEEELMQVFYGIALTPAILPDDTGKGAIYYAFDSENQVRIHTWNVGLEAWVQFNPSSSGGGEVGGFFVVATLAAMQALPSASTNKQCITQGYLEPGDDGGRIYTWYPNSTEPASGLAVVIPNDTPADNPGRWIQL